MKRNWKNRTLWTRDNLHVMQGLNSDSVDLIYLDPPFNSKRNYTAPMDDPADGVKFKFKFKDIWTFDDVDKVHLALLEKNDPQMFAIIDAARAVHSKGMASYLIMMSQRLVEMKRLLKETGSLYLHCDPTASHYLKTLLDCIFGHDNFINEIIWTYGLGGSSPRSFSRKHDVILFYSKSKKYHFDKPLIDATSNLMKGKQKGMTDTWNDIPSLNNRSKERVGYPTQKPLDLVMRIIEASSKLGDMVLDPFCGCATACVASEILRRKWIGIDISSKAAELVVTRLSDCLDETPVFIGGGGGQAPHGSTTPH